MTGGDDMDFYEDDEPVEEVVAAFERGEKIVTAPPIPGVSIQVSTQGGGHASFQRQSVAAFHYSSVSPGAEPVSAA